MTENVRPRCPAYGFIQNNDYFSKSLGYTFHNYSGHWLDYQLSLSDNPEKEIKKYRDSAYNNAIFYKYTAAQADGIANGVEDYLEDYKERRAEVFSMYKSYINFLIKKE